MIKKKKETFLWCDILVWKLLSCATTGAVHIKRNANMF